MRLFETDGMDRTVHDIEQKRKALSEVYGTDFQVTFMPLTNTVCYHDDGDDPV